MKHTIASPRRRQLMIAGLTGVAVPGALFAGLTGMTVPGALFAGSTRAIAAAVPAGEPLLVSGRVVTAAGQPVQHATIEFLHGGRERAVTDADGRFMAQTDTPRGGRLAYRVIRSGSGASYGSEALTHAAALRDDAGLWRAAFAATIA